MTAILFRINNNNAIISKELLMKLYKYNGSANVSGKRIRKRREELGLSQEELAGKLQLAGLLIGQKAISRIETGERVVPDFELLYFSEVLRVSVAELLGRE